MYFGLCSVLIFVLSLATQAQFFSTKPEEVCQNIQQLNFFIKSFLHDPNDGGSRIHLNISWNKPSSTENITNINLTFIGSCEHYNNRINNRYDVNLNGQGYLIYPDLNSRTLDDFKLNCEYKIITKYEDEICETINYKVPVCVEHFCDCEYLTKNKFLKLQLTPVNNSDSLYFLQWEKTLENTSDAKLNNITYRINGSNSKPVLAHILPNLENKTDRVRVILHLKGGKNYEVRSLFYYSSYCSFSAPFIYTVPIKPIQLTNTFLIWFLIPCFVFIVVLIILLMKLRRNRAKLRKIFSLCREIPDGPANIAGFTELKQKISNPLYIPTDFVANVDKYEFPRNKLKTFKTQTLGQGAFGKVYKGSIGSTNVAVKQLRGEASLEDIADFKAEIDIMKTIGEHQNIVKLLGCCTLDEPYTMIMEFVSCGNLEEYLINLRKKWINNKNNSNQVFFPEDMEVDDFKLNYSSYVFDDTDSASYIQPEPPLCLQQTPRITSNTWRAIPPSTPNSPWMLKPSVSFRNSTTKLPSNSSSQESPLLRCVSPNQGASSKLQENSSLESPNTPSSNTISTRSSRLNSNTDSILTNLDSSFEIVQITPVLNHTELQHFAFQIANGMAYLEQISITHRDLAARNVLMSNKKVLKISDFGMSRSGPYVTKGVKRVPLRWMAIEAIENAQYSSKTDVWSFGVVLWEIGTLGAYPYMNVMNEMILTTLKMGTRLDRPEICTDELYDLMLKCWAENPQNRPTFKEIVCTLDLKKKMVYVDFASISPNYLFPPIENHANGLGNSPV